MNATMRQSILVIAITALILGWAIDHFRQESARQKILAEKWMSFNSAIKNASETQSVLNALGAHGLFGKRFDEDSFEILRIPPKEPEELLPMDTAAAQQLQQAWAAHLQCDVEATNSLGMKFRLIPPGDFLMGSTAEQSDKAKAMLAPEDSMKQAAEYSLDEQPRHRVHISKAFYLGQHEVTQAQWKQVMKTEPWKEAAVLESGNELPAVNLTRDDAYYFCEKLGEQDGKKYRLPTEAEWEYACRAGSQTLYFFGDDRSQLNDYGWWGGMGTGNSGNTIHPVGLKKPNPWGLHDVYGNVTEICRDLYGADYYSRSPIDNPNNGSSNNIWAMRGGGYDAYGNYCRSASRGGIMHAFRNPIAGLRVVMEQSASAP